MFLTNILNKQKKSFLKLKIKILKPGSILTKGSDSAFPVTLKKPTTSVYQLIGSAKKIIYFICQRKTPDFWSGVFKTYFFTWWTMAWSRFNVYSLGLNSRALSCNWSAHFKDKRSSG